MFRLQLVKNDGSKTYDITPIVNQFSWDSTMSLVSVIDFSIIWNDARFIPTNPVEVGDLIIIYKDEIEVNRGIVVKNKQSGRSPIEYTAYDYAWYLGKSKSVYQFNNLSARQAISKILNDFGLPIGNITEMATIINKIYIQKSPAEIIQDIIKQHERQSGIKIFAEMRSGQIYIEKMRDMIVLGRFRLASNVARINVLDNPIGAERTQSIEEMRNRVKIILSKNDNYQTIALEQDTPMVSKYGLLEETFKIDEEDAAKARQAAKVLLKRLSRIHETNALNLMGDVSFKAGRLFDVVEPITGMEGRFMITNCKHEVASGFHTMNLTLTLPEDIA
ncbi:hypothetical protein SAMN05660297_02741 [Natronincola peptidivorans]|uniref:YqbQ/XkdQ domain-containing protein n=1 Tax=Natronincola peptidivorans TaxID=426128 RepID=A0A1I0FBG4_9FIRM|nr:hypothetical protein [Natronincola peptidivorans]SET55393.1 hypothetical protein SAMN05660297_02741 [Natronincola peptidivorans]